jgi:glutamate/tyrosine decarboxylase-like PLP-dependent enzyme
MHRFDERDRLLSREIFDYVEARLGGAPTLNAPASEAELQRRVGETVTEDGLGAPEAFRIFRDTLAPACVNCGHPRFLSFIPHAPSTASTLFDLALSASGIFADWWIEGAGAVYAENQALRWLADLLDWPSDAGGVFVSGGTAGNLSALAVARDDRRPQGDGAERRPAVALAAGAHSSLRLAARVLDLDVLDVPSDDRGRMLGSALRRSVDASELATCVVAATAGTTNLGVIDDLGGIADLCEERGLWMHVDGAYGGAALAVPGIRNRFAGIERADSFVVDPHKWLFAPLDCAALLYRDPTLARRTFAQTAEYIDSVENRGEWNPSDYAVHLSRRARGLPFWFSLATHGTRTYAEAIEYALGLARDAAGLIRETPYLELAFEPELSVVAFRRKGWEPRDYDRWSAATLADGLTLTAPTSWRGETLLRMCFLHPRTTLADVREIVASLADHRPRTRRVE